MRSASPLQLTFNRFKKNKLAFISGIYLVCLLGFILIYPLCKELNPNNISDSINIPPNNLHLFGTDEHGRDLFARTIYGTQVSILVGAVGALVSLFIGVIWGAVSGYLGGRIDSLMMRFVDILYSLPSIIFVIALMTSLEGITKEYFNSWGILEGDSGHIVRMFFLFVGLGSVSWLTMARIVRGQVLTLREAPFIEASKTLGASNIYIIFRHIIPNIAGIAIVYLTLTIPSIILNESFLSYLGIGIQPPQASLGSLIAAGAGQMNPIKIYWWTIVAPTSILVSILLALNFLGDGLRDALDPRTVK